MNEQTRDGRVYEVDEKEYQKLIGHKIRRLDKVVTVSVPDAPDGEDNKDESEIRESICVQALIAKIGSEMGMKIWIPQSDRTRVLKEWKNPHDTLLNHLHRPGV